MQPLSKPKTASNIVGSSWLLLSIAALSAVSPLLVHGVSCGQDLGFHIVSWLDAAQQLRHGHYPHWAVSPAWNAGEPRFLFYPPLSWLFGAALTMILPASAAPVVFIFLVLVAAAFSMYRLTRHFVSHDAALIASAFYIGNPYMLFNAFERSAMAELMASVWIPLLLLSILRERPTVRGIAVPLALLWLTNAPAAVIGSYTLALAATLRVLCRLAQSWQQDTLSLRGHIRFTLTLVTGTVLGLALAAFYLVPAAYERRYVQVAMAIIPNMRFQDNFLFDHTTDVAHNAVNHTASLLALGIIASTVVLISVLSLRNAKPNPNQDCSKAGMPLGILAVLTVIVAFLLVPISTPLWLHLPELAFLQFPWRLLSLLAVVLALSIAASLKTIQLPPWAKLLVPMLSLTLSILGYGMYAQQCEPADKPSAIATLLQTHHGVPPTDEYTPTNADNDILRTNSPGYWLTSNPNAPAPYTVPTAAELNPAIGTDDVPVPPTLTLSRPAPHHLRLETPESTVLILNLRDFPCWDVTRTGAAPSLLGHLSHIQRDDGLLAISLPAGISTIDIRWRRSTDQWIGIAISALALFDLLFSASIRSRVSARPGNSLE